MAGLTLARHRNTCSNGRVEAPRAQARSSHRALKSSPALKARLALAVSVATLAAVAFPSAAAADHWRWFDAWHINNVGTPLSSYSHSDGNSGDTDVDGLEDGEPNYCSGAGGTNYFNQTVWFEIHPHRVGNVSIRATSTTSGYKPVVHLAPFTPGVAAWSYGPCEVTGAGGVAGLPTQRVAAGSHYKLQIGADTTGAAIGTYHLDVIYDPDSDGDNILDSADGCDSQRGPASNGGCPPGVHPTDTDGDHIPDNEDKCPKRDARKRDKNHDGCLDLVRILAVANLDPGRFLSPTNQQLGLKVKHLRIKRLPRKARVELLCKRNGRKVCAKQVLKAGGKGKLEFHKMRGKNLHAGTKLYIRATLPKAVGRYIEYTIARGDFEKRELCLKPGKRRPTKCSAGSSPS